MAANQPSNPGVLALRSTCIGLKLENAVMQEGSPALLCDFFQVVIPASLSQGPGAIEILNRFTPSLPHEFSSKFVWPGFHKDVKGWVVACLKCEPAKVHMHTKLHFEPDVSISGY